MDRNTITEVLIGNSPGFISSDVVPPSRPKSNEWTMVLNFRSQDELTAWQRSSAPANEPKLSAKPSRYSRAEASARSRNQTGPVNRQA